jgi:hypothetical protein
MIFVDSVYFDAYLLIQCLLMCSYRSIVGCLRGNKKSATSWAWGGWWATSKGGVRQEAGGCWDAWGRPEPEEEAQKQDLPMWLGCWVVTAALKCVPWAMHFLSWELILNDFLVLIIIDTFVYNIFAFGHLHLIQSWMNFQFTFSRVFIELFLLQLISFLYLNFSMEVAENLGWKIISNTMIHRDTKYSCTEMENELQERLSFES